uniref:non-specific serine/threonine protein kinase n=1 Tax=Heterosigma akashiwo TaxID=2829 RepID=A0A7S4DC48_HETAK
MALQSEETMGKFETWIHMMLAILATLVGYYCFFGKRHQSRKQQEFGEAENTAAKSGTLNIDFKNDQSFEGMYELQRELGSGSFSTVREGIHKQTNERFAVKVIKRMNLSREDEEALAEEVTILHGINHPNIIKVFDFFEEKDFYYLVTELMQGGELFDRIVKKTFYNEKEARDLVKILLSIVKHCHENDIVHRDLKPENLLMTSADDDIRFALADFGFAKLLRGNTLTLTEQCGTPGYVAPEILNGVPYGKPVDMWSFGVILYILLGGYAPFSENNQSKLFAKIKSGAYEFHPDFWGNVSSDAKDLIARMLQVDVAKRITVEAAYNHPWVQADADVLAERALDGNLEELRRFNARRKFKAGGKAIVAANRLASMIQQAK